MTTLDPTLLFAWTGDLEDDCHCAWNGMTVQAEHLDDRVWFAAVVRGRNTLFHSLGADIIAKTGPAARELCEWVMKAEAWRAKAAELQKELDDDWQMDAHETRHHL